MHVLIRATMGRRDRCHSCRRPWTDFLFKGPTSSIWQRRCRRCAEQMVKDGKATYQSEARR